VKRWHLNALYIALILVGVTYMHELWVAMDKVETLAYSEFMAQVASGNVAEASINDQRISGVLKQPLADGNKQFVTTRVEPEIAKDLAQHGIKFSAVQSSSFVRQILDWVAPALIFVTIWILVIRYLGEERGLGGGALAIGKSKAHVYAETDVRVTFDDVAGVDEAKEELQEVVGFLKDPKGHGRLGARVPKGVLLVGPPGTGKTLFARAIAGEAGVPFFSINGSEFVEMFVGVGAARVRDLFEQARQHAPAIIFIDEIDALGRARGVYGGFGGHDEKEQTLNQLLAELDGFDPTVGLVLLAATNRPEILDPALLRAGRFDRQILVDRPDKTGRVQILKVHLRKIQLAADVDAGAIAALTPGFSGADLANLVNEAALLATRHGADAVALADFTSAIERIVAGLEKKNRLLNPLERKTVAYHEMGHALVALSLPDTDPIHKVSIIPRGVGALGYTIQRPTEDRYLMTLQELEDKMAVLLGGRVAEELVFGQPSTGAADDLVKVTDIARNIVLRYGMDPNLGGVVYEETPSPLLGEAPVPASMKPYSEVTAQEIDKAVRDLVRAARLHTMQILTRYRSQLEAGAAQLLAQETLSEADLLRIKKTLQPELKAQTVAA
jgi:cell division protease FtsH